ncbi:SH3 domain-containing protein [Pseudoprevotella muciniphila]|uniref:SH3 domain-containing protein n=1 Tax=Pseudoprevotella muciniphila TaxID=2133944 RepID=A0A5P8E721_9BACT|nr:SH3 domain-containing protein [Pseudoprevotella muciniphila]QFQ12742.1 SH3 domain-containing protein [Pseudoprevotella muciniphila]
MSVEYTNAQKVTYYRVTADRLNVRTGPGTNYRVVKDWGEGMLDFFQKGTVVCTKFAPKKGFVKVRFAYAHDDLSEDGEIGWVSLKYLTPAKNALHVKEKDTQESFAIFCNGEECDGELAIFCINGYMPCKNCEGAGYK